ncbi:MAG: hypothetical protein WCI11_08925 [Candidatus Methylumidiphilus sp.]
MLDVKAKDSEGRLYQIEIQLLTYWDLPERMVYIYFLNTTPSVVSRKYYQHQP